MAPNLGICTSEGVDPDLLARAINDVLHLNCERLRLARQSVVSNVTEWVVPLLKEVLDGSHLAGSQLFAMTGLVVAARLQPDVHGHLRAFWTTERQYLPGSDTWVSEHRQRLNLG